MTTLYAKHFHLSEAPFSIAPNPRFLFMSEQHREALAHLLYGIGHDGGFVLLTGEVGTGKTTLCRCLLGKIPADTDVAFIINPRLSVVDLLANICDELGIAYIAEALNNRLLVDAINHYLLSRYAEGRKTVLIIDEAQNLDAEVLEQLRLLTNLETDERKLLQIILLGQPELQDKLARNELRQLSQRITARYHLQALSRDDMKAYIKHRLTVAGCDQSVFSPSALRFVYRQSKGIPRLVNLICDRAMLGAFASGVTGINQQMTHQAAREVLGGQVERTGSAGWKPVFLWSASAILLIVMVGWSFERWLDPQPSSVVSTLSQEQVAQSAPTKSNQIDSIEADSNKAEAPALSDSTDSNSPYQLETNGIEATLVKGEEAEAETIKVQSNIAQSRQTAFHDLFATWGINLPENTDPCVFALSQDLACLQQVGDLGRLRSLNRPAVLEWQTDNGEIMHITVIEISGSTARIVAGDRQIDLPLEQLRQHWLERFVILWHTPLAYRSDILPGTAGPSAKWLNDRLLALDSTPAKDAKAVRTSGLYQGVWVRRLRQFQRNAGLFPDGVAGPQTLIQLNTLLHEPGPRLMNAMEKALALEAAQLAGH